MKRIKRTSVLISLVILAECSHYLVNSPKPSYEADFGYRYLPKTQTVKQDKIYVVLALSGGGTRAAALSDGVMEKLRATPIHNG